MTFQLVGVVAGVVLEQDKKFLLVQEAHPKVYGKWNLPAGRVDEGETIKEAAAREAKEEAGFDVEVGRELIVLHQDSTRPVLHAFDATITGGQLKVQEGEILDAKWFTLEEIRNMKPELRNAEFVLGAIEAWHKTEK